MRVRWLRTALANLDAEAEYIAEDNPAAAGRVVLRILRAVDLLKKNPAMGRAGRVVGTRELVVAGTPYIVPYRVRGEALEILRVFHAARKCEAAATRPDLKAAGSGGHPPAKSTRLKKPTPSSNQPRC